MEKHELSKVPSMLFHRVQKQMYEESIKSNSRSSLQSGLELV